MKILIVEDEPSLMDILQRYLQQERYLVETAATFAEAIQKIEDYEYSCILLDIMLPDGDGLTLLEHLKSLNKNDNVIILSAKDSIDDKVTGLELGADDYMAKPFDLSELNARIKSVLRRKHSGGQLSISNGNVKLYPDRFEVYVNEKKVELLRKEYDILHFFMVRPEFVVSKDTLAEAVWGDHIDQVDNFDFVYAQIKNLRKKLKAAKASIEIKSVYGLGYKLFVEEL